MRTPRPLLCAAAFATAVLSGCSCQTKPVVDAPRVPFLGECSNDVDCEEGICQKTDPAAEKGTCTRRCADDCPDAFACVTVSRGDGNTDICMPAKDTICTACSNDRDCGDDSDHCLQIGAGSFCSIDCAENPSVCPTGFQCRLFGERNGKTGVAQCVPINNVCCIDADADRRGRGDECVAGDCNDADPRIYDDAVDLCDGIDNNCKAGTDETPTNCAGASCALGQASYSELAAEPCTAGVCVTQTAVDCGLYTCSEGLEEGDECANACDGEDDKKCIPPAHCEASVCTNDLADGLACNENSDCISDHCQNGFCCSGGDCCSQPSDCPNVGVQAATCDTAATCQGTFGEITCVNSRCAPNNGLANDTACSSTTLANTCGFYPSVFCNGMLSQTQPSCATSCTTNADCDADGFCHPTFKTCVEDLDNGGACGADNDACKSGHCQNGFCCATGDCCASELDCPASYTSAAVCDSAALCQGTQDVARCVMSQCQTQADEPNDIACGTATVANECGPYLPISCSGNATQTPPMCATSCTTNTECDANAYCTASGACVPDEPNGNGCSADAACQSGHCQNGFCCATGDCCATNGNCGMFAQAPMCNSQSTCQGTRVDGVCTAAFQCVSTTVDDDSACAGLESNACGPYPAVSCTNAADQPADQAGRCGTSCTNDNGCDVSANCTANVCVPDVGPGGFCTSPAQCLGGLFCVDSVCCSSACNGSCEACDLPGSVGTCTTVPAGQDPDAECGGVSCAAYYAGFIGDSCYRKADVTAAQAACNGAGACRTTAQECTLQTNRQTTAALTCNNFCQDPTGGTCTGTTAGTCTNVNQGTATCGSGPCTVTAPRCVNGSPNACTPNTSAASAETCNDVDDNCDGVTDNGTFSDNREPNNSCAAAAGLGAVGSDQTLAWNTSTIYPSGDVDVFRITANETDSSCACCDFFCTDEDYQFTVTLTVPANAGSYQFCIGNTGECGSGNLPYCQPVSAGGSASWTYQLDGACASGDSYSFFVKVEGLSSPGFECSPYRLTYGFDADRCF